MYNIMLYLIFVKYKKYGIIDSYNIISDFLPSNWSLRSHDIVIIIFIWWSPFIPSRNLDEVINL